MQETKPVYDLYAISNHFGGMGGGHYTACCQLNEDGQWYYFDDSSTYPVRAEDVVTEAAYVLFYRRRIEALQDTGDTMAHTHERLQHDDGWQGPLSNHACGGPLR